MSYFWPQSNYYREKKNQRKAKHCKKDFNNDKGRIALHSFPDACPFFLLLCVIFHFFPNCKASVSQCHRSLACQLICQEEYDAVVVSTLLSTWGYCYISSITPYNLLPVLRMTLLSLLVVDQWWAVYSSGVSNTILCSSTASTPQYVTLCHPLLKPLLRYHFFALHHFASVKYLVPHKTTAC